MKPDRKTVLVAALLVLSAFLLVGTLLMPLPMPFQINEEVPLESLTPEEEKRVINIALADPSVQKLLDGQDYNVSGIFSMCIAPAPGCDVYDVECGYADRYALVTIDTPNTSTNMSACMTVNVNLNESIVEYISFEMIPMDGGGIDYDVSSANTESPGV